MAGVFDISTYENVAGKNAINPEVLAQANRAARVAKFGEDAVARMEQAGARFGATPAQPAAAAASPVAPAAAEVPVRGRVARALNPNLTLRGLGAVAKGGAAFAPLAGGVQSVFDSPESVAQLGDTVGIDASTGAGRFGANALNFLNNTGNAATFGLAGRLGRMLSGGSFFGDDPYALPAAAPAAKVAANAAGSDAGLPAPNGGVNARIGATPSVQRVAGTDNIAAANAVLDGDYTGSGSPAPGTGFIRRNSTGDIRQFVAGGATPSASEGPDRFGYRKLIAGIGAAKRRQAQTAELSAQGAYLRGEAAYMKAEEGAGGNKTDIIPSLNPKEAPTVVQVKGGVARSLPVIQPLPAGSTAESLRAEAAAAMKRAPGQRSAILQKLQSYGVQP